MALRGWASHWHGRRLRLRVKSDSVSALILVLRMKTSGRASGIIAREVALDVAASCYAPALAEHVPGVANVVADALSRRFEPGCTFAVPRCLLEVPELELPPRDASYYRTLGAPPATPAKQGD